MASCLKPQGGIDLNKLGEQIGIACAETGLAEIDLRVLLDFYGADLPASVRETIEKTRARMETLRNDLRTVFHRQEAKTA